MAAVPKKLPTKGAMTRTKSVIAMSGFAKPPNGLPAARVILGRNRRHSDTNSAELPKPRAASKTASARASLIRDQQKRNQEDLGKPPSDDRAADVDCL